jgi:hypothetical protein
VSCRAGAGPPSSRTLGAIANSRPQDDRSEKPGSRRRPRRRDPPLSIRQSFREIRKGIVVLWWAFFDWVAVVQWKALVLVSFLP